MAVGFAAGMMKDVNMCVKFMVVTCIQITLNMR